MKRLGTGIRLLLAVGQAANSQQPTANSQQLKGWYISECYHP